MAGQNACAACWNNKDGCVKTGPGRCLHCTQHGPSNQPTIVLSGQFPKEELRQSLLPHGPSPNLDTEDSEEVVLCVTTANNPRPISSSTYTGPGNTQNASLMHPLNRGMHKAFSAPLHVQDAALEIMGKARSAGEWLDMFWRARIIEHVQVLLDGKAVDTVQQLWVESQFRALALSRIGELVAEVMTAIRLAQGADERKFTHAAAAILRREITTFSTAMRRSHPNPVPVATRELLLQWLSTVAEELHTRICKGCDEIQSWDSVFLGPRKEFRTTRSRERPIVVTLTLRRNKRSTTGAMGDDTFAVPNRFGREISPPLGESPPSPTGSMTLSPPIENYGQPFAFPKSPPPTTKFQTPSVSEWELLTNGCVIPSWLSKESNHVPSFYPDHIALASRLPTSVVEANMKELRSDLRFNHHLALSREEDEMDLDPAEYPPEVVEDDEDLMETDEDLFEHIDFHDDDDDDDDAPSSR